MAEATRELLAWLITSAPPRDRAFLAESAHARAAIGYGIA